MPKFEFTVTCEADTLADAYEMMDAAVYAVGELQTGYFAYTYEGMDIG